MNDISNCVPIPGGVSCNKYVVKQYSYSIEKGTYPVWNVRPDNIGFESIALLQNWLFVNHGPDACITELELGSGNVLGQICAGAAGAAGDTSSSLLPVVFVGLVAMGYVATRKRKLVRRIQ